MSLGFIIPMVLRLIAKSIGFSKQAIEIWILIPIIPRNMLKRLLLKPGPGP